jgi:hypothetical protein
MQEEMDVGIDQPGEQRGVAEVDDSGALGMIHRGGDGANAIPFDQYFAGLEQGSGIDLEQARGVEDDGRGGRLLRVGYGSKEGERCAEGKETNAVRKSRHG